MHLRRTTALATGALLLVTPLLTACNPLTGRNEPTQQEYVPAAGVNNRDASVDVLGAVIVSAQPGSGTFIASLVNGSPDEDAALTALAGAGGDTGVAVEDFTEIDVPARGIVNLAETEGLPMTGEFEAGQFVEVQVDLSTGETVTMAIPVVPDAGVFTGLDTSSA